MQRNYDPAVEDGALMQALIVEDEVIIGIGLAYELEAEGWATILVANGAEALQALAAQRFDLAIVDLGLPGESGSSLIRRMQQLAPTMRLVVCTGYPSFSSPYRDLPMSIRVVRKPCSAAEFMRAVHATVVSTGQSW
jgi:DNA-binding response OmpR family regulator